MVSKKLAVAGSGAIACGLAATAAHHGPVLLLARSESSAERARDSVERTLARLGAEVDPEHVQIVTDQDALTEATFVVEAVVEDHDVKAGLLRELDEILRPDAILASTTSSLSIERLAQESGRPDRFVGLHVFNPVTRMKLVELIFPTTASEETRSRALALCENFEKTPVVVPDVPGFVVNRLLFPYLFNAVRCSKRRAWTPLTSTPACASARGTRWARSRCWTWSGSTSPRRSARRSASRAPRGRGADRGGRPRAQDRARIPHVLRLSRNIYRA